MKIEFKKFRSFPGQSEETLAFQADLWVDGKLAGEVSNSGKGGASRICGDSALIREFVDYGDTLPGVTDPLDPEDTLLPMDADNYLDLMAGKYLDLENIRRLDRAGKTVFRVVGQKPESYWTVKMPYCQETREKIAKTNEVVEFLNERLTQPVDIYA